MPRFATLLATFAFAMVLSLAGANALAKAAEPPGELLASIEMLEGWKIIEKRTGWWFYAQKTTGNRAGPLITGYHYENGKLVDEFGGGSEPELFEAIHGAKLEQFDLDQEAERAGEELTRQANARGEIFMWGLRDGARYRVTVVTAAGRFQYEDWNVQNLLDGLWPASDKFRRLKEVLDRLRSFYSDSKLWY